MNTVAFVLVLLTAAQGAQSAIAAPSIVFVCEHGAAKSVIATAYFTKLASERGFPTRATLRGTTPQAELSVRTLEGLRADGLVPPNGKPTVIADQDVAQATHIFAIGCTLPDKARDGEDV